MVKIGPSGIDPIFIEDGITEFDKMLSELKKRYNLNLCEYSFSHGITVSDEICEKIAVAAKNNNIEITAHAPFYINYGNPEPEFLHKGNNYVVTSLKKLALMGGRKLCVHLGSQGKNDRKEILELIKTRLKRLIEVLDKNKLFDVVICFEVMGKYSQIGNLEEIVEFAKLDKRFNLTLDVGHLNCIMQGGLKTKEDFVKVFNYIKSNLPDKYQDMHIHFSKIMYNDKGEMKHLTLEDNVYGPDFTCMATALKECKIEPTIICESKAKMAQDAYIMQNIWNGI